MSHPVFKKKFLASCVAAACSMSMSMVAQAQNEGVDEEVVVFGIRGSLERSADIKREAIGVVDAISAEDIGKFPDTNLAESLQRITGVSIDRRNGEGNEITVRGFGPAFNLVLLNGRTLPSSGINQSKTQGSNSDTDRSFDMSNLAAEGVSGVEVYKSSRADLPTGGIGATVNLKTRRPFDQEGVIVTVGAKALHDSTVRIGDNLTPELSAFASWSDDTFGASVAYTYQRRDSGQSGVFTNNWSAQVGPWADADMINSVPYLPPSVDIDGDGTPAGNEPQRRNDGQFAPAIPVSAVRVLNEPAQGQLTHLTDGIRYYHEDHKRIRKNGQMTFQYRPLDELTLTLDYTKAEQELFNNGAELSFWFGGGTFPATDVQFDDHPQVRTSEYLWIEDPTGTVRDIGITQNQGHVINDLESTGFNAEWDFSDTLSFEFDMHSSESSSLPPSNDTIGTYFNIALGAQGNWAQGYDNSGDLPLLVGVWGDDNRGDPDPEPEGVDNIPSNPGAGVVTSTGDVAGELDVADLGSTVRQGWFARSWSEVDQFRISGSWDLSDELSIDFGVDSRSMEAMQKVSSLQQVLEGNWGVGTPGDVPPTMLQELDYADLFDGYNTSLSPEAQAFFGPAGLATNPNIATNSGAAAEVFTTGWIANDAKELGRWLTLRAPADNSTGLPLEWEPATPDSTDRIVEEEINAFYVQGSYEQDVAGMPLNAILGVRYEDTEITTRAQVAPESIIWQGDNDLIANPVGSAADAAPSIGEGEYDHTLPSLSVSLGVTDDIVARFAYSTTISRPDYGQMQEGVNNVQSPVGGPTIVGSAPGSAANGNAGLEPLESDNIDLSLEWYYADASYVSIGYFQKDVQNFTGTQVEDQEIEVTLDPTNGPRAVAAQQQLIALGRDPNNQQDLFMMVASLSAEGDGCATSFGAGENIGNSANCGDAFGSHAYEVWEDNIDITARSDDPAYIARVGFPVGDKTAELDGWELAVQHFFGDTGFGVQANYTMVDSDDIAFDITAPTTETQFALLGLSDSANLVLMYELNAWSARLAYNWRDKFLYSTTSSVREPGHTEEYAQLDLNVGYDVTDNFSVSFEAINLTGEDQRNYARTERQLIQLGILDTRYALGARFSFD